MARSLLRQLAQISGSFVYDDTLPMAIAETASDLSLEKDLNFLRSQFKVVTGETNWFDAPVASLAGLESSASADIAGLKLEDAYIDSFIGKAIGINSPAYTSQIYITNGDSLETAIGELDAAVNTNESSASVDIAAIVLEDAYQNAFMGKAAGSDLPAYTSQIYITNGESLETACGELDAAIAGVAGDKLVEDIVAVIAAESGHTLPHGKTYTVDPTGEGLNLDVFANGQLLAVDSGSTDRDYEETSTSSVTFHFTVEENSNLVYIIRL